MSNIALKLPGIDTPISPPPNFDPTHKFTDLGSVISATLEVVFIIAFFLTFIWMVWGAFHYIFAGGDKEQLAKARSRIITAVIGLLLIAISFALAQFVQQILSPAGGTPLSLVQTVYADEIVTPTPINLEKEYPFGGISSLGQGIQLLVVPAFSIATVAVVIYLIIGAVTYLVSGGNKESVAKAQGMMTHAIIGFVLLMVVFLIMQFIPEYFGFPLQIIGR